jgi:hypothetical protein
LSMCFLSSGKILTESSQQAKDFGVCLSPLSSKNHLYFERALNVTAQHGHFTFR